MYALKAKRIQKSRKLVKCDNTDVVHPFKSANFKMMVLGNHYANLCKVCRDKENEMWVENLERYATND